jgi:hypothetical protein
LSEYPALLVAADEVGSTAAACARAIAGAGEGISNRRIQLGKLADFQEFQ